MSDLINRSELIKELNKYCGNQRYLVSENIREIINNQPTAYDIDKVIDELEHTMSNDGLPGEIIWNNVLKIAIEIVKQGGVSDDVCEWMLCDEEANVYDTSCRNPHILIEGTPKENNYEYCPYCGKKIKVVDQMDEEDFCYCHNYDADEYHDCLDYMECEECPYYYADLDQDGD